MSRIAVHLDAEMFLRRGIVVAPATTPESALTPVLDPDQHFAGRLLVRYVRKSDLAQVTSTTWQNRTHWLTTTPLCKGSVRTYLNLPSSLPAPTHALLVDPLVLQGIRGPRYVRLGFSVEYLVPTLPDASIVGNKWAVEI